MSSLEFNTPVSNEMIEAQKKIKELVNDMYLAKVQADEAEAKFKSLKSQVSQLMESTGTEKIVGDLCNVSGSIKSNTSLAKEEEEKYKQLKYIEDNYGKIVIDSMLTINARTFTSWVTAEKEKLAREGKNLDEFNKVFKSFETFSLNIRKKASPKTAKK